MRRGARQRPVPESSLIAPWIDCALDRPLAFYGLIGPRKSTFDRSPLETCIAYHSTGVVSGPGLGRRVRRWWRQWRFRFTATSEPSDRNTQRKSNQCAGG